MTSRIRVGLLFGNHLVREGRRLLLQTQPDLDIVWEGSDGVSAVEDLAKAVVDVVLVDNRLTGISGVETIRRFLRRNLGEDSSVPAFVLTGPFTSGVMSLEAIRCGAADLVTEEDDPEELIAAIRAASALDPGIDFAAMQDFFESMGIQQGSNTRWLLRLNNITEDEQSVLDALTGGVQFGGLTDATGLPATKVRWILDALQKRWNFVSRAQLALALHESGLLPPVPSVSAE
jgi:DNA-binding NarL/FixJ family response regulator